MTKANRALLLHATGGLALALSLLVAAHWFPVAEYVTQAQRKITDLEIGGAILYPLLFAACNILLLPGGILAIGAGLFFGLWWGWLLNVLGSTLGALIAVALARKFGRGWVQRRLHPNGRWARLDAAVSRQGPWIIFLSQVHPLFPTSLLNYLYGLTRVPIRTCVLWIALGQAPGMFLYAFLGRFAQSGLRVWRGQASYGTLDWVWWIAGLLSVLILTIILGRIALRALKDADDVPANGEASPAPVSDLQQ